MNDRLGERPIAIVDRRASPFADAQLVAGAATGVGSLPHRSAREASEFALTHYDVPAVPSLPRRSPAEAMVAQAVLGIHGVTTGQYGGIAVDVGALDAGAPVATDVAHDAFRGLRSFVFRSHEAGYTGPVKWQFVGPITLGMALHRAGVPGPLAFDVAVSATAAHIGALADAIENYLPECAQIVVVDEPWFGEVSNPGFPLAPEEAVDLLSRTMAAAGRDALVGIHCCGQLDLPSLLAAGPLLVSMPARPALAEHAGYIDRFLEGGGRIAWGVASTDRPFALDGPSASEVDRGWKRLRALWHELVRRGVDPYRLLQQSLVTPDCGLAAHSPAVAERVCATVRGIGERVRYWHPDSAR